MELIDTTMPRLVALAKRLLEDVADFYKVTDPAHRIDHIEWVMANVLTIYNTIDLGVYDDQKEAAFKLALIAAAYHDIYSHERKFHHFMSFQYVMDNREALQEKYGLHKFQLVNVAYACMEHRGSWNAPYRGLVSEIVAAADRGLPDEFDLKEALKRSYLYARTTGGKSVPDAQKHAVGHLKDKYGASGYGAVPDWYKAHFRDVLKARSELLESLRVDAIDPFMIYDWEKIIEAQNERS